MISLDSSVDSQILAMLREKYKIILLSSNSFSNIIRVLNHLDIPISLFDEIICSDQYSFEGGFKKREAFLYLRKSYRLSIGEILSIGDRYETDVLPCLRCGGDGVVSYKPMSINKIAMDIINDSLHSCSEYSFVKDISTI